MCILKISKTCFMPDIQKNHKSSWAAEWNYLPSQYFHRCFLIKFISNTNSFVDDLTQEQILSTHVSFVFFPLCDLPLALSSYLRLTAPAPASSTGWCLRVSRPSPPNQRRSTPFLPRGSAPSARARTAWPTAPRSEAWSLWEVKGQSLLPTEPLC